MRILSFFLLLLFIGCSSHQAGHYVYLSPESNLNSIAKKFKVSVSRIREANAGKKLSNGSWIFVPTNKKALMNRFVNRSLAEQSYGNKLFDWPVPSSRSISSFFGKRGRRYHDGIDIPAKKGSHIIAAKNGIVLFNGRLSGYGKVLIISHNKKFHTVYAHLNRSYARKGEKVTGGQVIAQVGTTGRTSGPHLHFEVRYQNKILNPIPYMKKIPHSALANR